MDEANQDNHNFKIYFLKARSRVTEFVTTLKSWATHDYAKKAFTEIEERNTLKLLKKARVIKKNICSEFIDCFEENHELTNCILYYSPRIAKYQLLIEQINTNLPILYLLLFCPLAYICFTTEYFASFFTNAISGTFFILLISSIFLILMGVGSFINLFRNKIYQGFYYALPICTIFALTLFWFSRISNCLLYTSPSPRDA